MSTVPILNLPVAIGLTGAEWAEVQRPDGVSERTQLSQIAGIFASVAPTGPVGSVVGAPVAGPNNDYNAEGQFGAVVGFLDLNSAGPCNVSGVTAGFNGQILIITNISPFLATLNKLSAASSPFNQFRMPDDFFLSQYDGKSFKYSTAIGKWVAM